MKKSELIKEKVLNKESLLGLSNLLLFKKQHFFTNENIELTPHISHDEIPQQSFPLQIVFHIINAVLHFS